MRKFFSFILLALLILATVNASADKICKTWVYDLEDTYIILSKIDCGDGRPGFGGMLLGYDGTVMGAWGSLDGKLEVVEMEETVVVYAAKGGTCYHSKKDCHGMSGAWEIPLCIAQRMELKPCKNCNK